MSTELVKLLETLGKLLENYTHFAAGLFFGLHIIVLVVTCMLFVQFVRMTNRLRREIPRLPLLIEAQCKRRLEPVTSFEQYFDACTTAIILIGLAGTMYGFVRAVPNLKEPGYTFADLEQALSASAFGIFWALLVMLVVHFYRWSTVDPIAQRLRALQTEDVQFEHWRELAKQTWQQVATKMEESATRFSNAAERIAHAMTETSADTRNSIVALDAAREASAKTATDITAMLNAAMKLPETVRSSLDEIARQSAERLTATTAHFDQSLQRLETIPARFHESFTDLFMKQHEQLNKTLKDYSGALETIQSVFLDSVQQSQSQFSNSLDHTISQFGEQINALRELPAGLNKLLHDSLQDQLQAIRSAQELYREGVEHLQQQTTSAFSDARVTILDVLARVGEFPGKVDERLAQFAESQRGLSQALMDDQRGRMAELFNHGVIQMGQLEAKTQSFVEAYRLHVEEDHAKLTARLQAVIPDLVSALIKEMREAAKPISDSAAKLDEGFEGLFADAKKRVQDAVTTSLNTVTKIIEDFREGLRATQRGLPESIRSAQAEVIEQTVNCAATVARCADELSRTAQDLPHSLEQLRPQIYALNEAARRIRDAAADFAGIKGIFDRSFEPLKQELQDLRRVTATVEPEFGEEAKGIAFWQRFLIWPKSKKRRKDKNTTKMAGGGE